MTTLEMNKSTRVGTDSFFEGIDALKYKESDLVILDEAQISKENAINQFIKKVMTFT